MLVYSRAINQKWLELCGWLFNLNGLIKNEAYVIEKRHGFNHYKNCQDFAKIKDFFVFVKITG